MWSEAGEVELRDGARQCGDTGEAEARNMTSPEPTSAESLDEAREELARRLEEACQTGAPGTPAGVPETTGELIRLEGALQAAAKATEDMIAARKRANVATGENRTTTDSEVSIEHGHERIREFRDSEGQEWRVWAVTPGMASPSSQKYLGELRHGWLAFEALSGAARRRLVNFPPNWIAMNDQQLEELLHQAAVAQIRKRPEAGA